LIKSDVKVLQRYFEQNDQSVFMAASFFKSLASEKQLAGIMGTLASSLSKIALPEIFYIMSGEPEVNLVLNDLDSPTLLTLSNTNELAKTYSPALALIMSMSLKLMNQAGRHHSIIMLEEASTLIIPEFDNIPATSRSNKIANFIIAQDMVQLEDGYTRLGRDKLLATLATHIYGRASDSETAERYSKMFGTIEKTYTSISSKPMQMGNSGYTDSKREVRKHKPEKFHSLDTGHFLGFIGDGNIKELNARFKCYEDIPVELPIIHEISKEAVQENFDKIIKESKEIL
jgi:type IV secretory pathway TraG/TraD family ATPase VirD4